MRVVEGMASVIVVQQTSMLEIFYVLVFLHRVLNRFFNNMETSGDPGQVSTSLMQLTSATTESNSTVLWASAFQSLEFMLGLQMAVSQALHQYNTPTDRIT